MRTALALSTRLSVDERALTGARRPRSSERRHPGLSNGRHLFLPSLLTPSTRTTPHTKPLTLRSSPPLSYSHPPCVSRLWPARALVSSSCATILPRFAHARPPAADPPSARVVSFRSSRSRTFKSAGRQRKTPAREAEREGVWGGGARSKEEEGRHESKSMQLFHRWPSSAERSQQPAPRTSNSTYSPRFLCRAFGAAGGADAAEGEEAEGEGKGEGRTTSAHSTHTPGPSRPTFSSPPPLRCGSPRRGRRSRRVVESVRGQGRAEALATGEDERGAGVGGEEEGGEEVGEGEARGGTEDGGGIGEVRSSWLMNRVTGSNA